MAPEGQAAAANDQGALMLGLQLQNSGKLDEAAVVFSNYLKTHPYDGVATYSLALIMTQRQDQAGAMTLLANCLTHNQNFAPLWMAYGSVLQGFAKRSEALAAYGKALALNPQYVEALVNSGVLMREEHRHIEALDCFQRVLAIKPDHETALGNCGIILTEFKKSEEAVAMFQRLLALNPNYEWGLGLLVYERMHACDWTDFEPLTKQIIDGINQGKHTCKSLPLMALSSDCASHQLSARMFGERFPISPRPLWTGERYRHKKIRVAYVSPDLREHPVGHLMAGIFEHHDKSRFETIAISLGIDDKSRLRGRMLAAFDKFVDARLMSSRAIAELMRELEVDIAVDLAGYTADSRTDVFGHRPAPAHVNFLGYPGTMGVPYMDYIVADRYVIPPEHQRYYDEKVVYLPDAYLPTDGGLKIAERTPTRAECGLPDEGVVFCSFSHDYKINPALYDIWMRLLKQVPGSVLWLMSRSEASQRNLRNEASKRGVDPSRIVFAKRVPMVEDHLARYRQADIFLDTHPYNAHTTAADALMAGLPVVTYLGGAFPSRVAGSLLHAVNMPDLVADSVEGYEALALRLATNPAELAEVKARLAANRHTTALFDTPEFCRQLENVYTTIWHDSQVDKLIGRDSSVEAAKDAIKDGFKSRAPEAAAPVAATFTEDFTVGTAESDIQRGNLQKAEMQCRQQLEQVPGHVGALKLLGDIASRIGAHDFAVRYYTDVLRSMPEARAAASSVKQLLNDTQAKARSAAATPGGQDKYMLIKAWGYGFWSDLDHVAAGLLLAEITGRKPIVHWGTNSLFRNPDSVNAFEGFFEPVSALSLDALQRDGLSFYPAKWHQGNLTQEDNQKWAGEGSRLSGLYMLRRDEDVVVSDFHTKVNDLIPWIPEGSPLSGMDRSQLYRHLFAKYIRLQPALQARVDQQANAMFAGKQWLAVHMRGSDKVKEMAHLDAINQAYWSSIDKILQVNPGLNIFLLTDSDQLLAEFKQRYGDKVFSLDCVRSSNDQGVHYAGHSGMELGEQVILDSWLAARCDMFLGNGGSNVSVGVRHLKDWRQGTFFLLGNDFLGERNMMLHNW
jgi:predicted O-linked N-acetylglucosamine transferase (SPINDLY family)